ncbi:hypothetical protein SAMN02910447_02057, partial [Ruminococcus sp. YE71]
MKRSWKRVTAGIMALSMVTGSVPFEPISQAVTSMTAVTASADETLYSVGAGGSADCGSLYMDYDDEELEYTLRVTVNEGYEFVKITAWDENLGDEVEYTNGDHVDATTATFQHNFTAYFQKTEEESKIELDDNNTVITLAENSADIVSVKYNGQTLSENTDYYVLYQQNYAQIAKPTAPGVYQVAIAGMGGYTGWVFKTFSIASTKTTLTAENTTVTMADNSAEIESVVVGETTLSATTDYTVSYKQGETDLESAPTEPGTYTAVITGTG